MAGIQASRASPDCFRAQGHSSLYPMSATVIRDLASELTDYETSKGTIRFPPDSPPPARLVAKILKARMAELQPRDCRC